MLNSIANYQYYVDKSYMIYISAFFNQNLDEFN